jgi:hypothetical protein
VGDAHQPLHAASWFGKETPHGDRGGNDFKLEEGNNLHKLWDSAGGQFSRVEQPDHFGYLPEIAQTVVKQVPPDSVPEWKNVDFAVWLHESTTLARDVAYGTPRGQKPDAAYMAQLQKMSARRIAIAGYRLADLLNRIFEADAIIVSSLLSESPHGVASPSATR